MKATCGRSPTARRATRTRDIRPTASGSPSSPIAAAAKRSTSSRPTARASRRRSPISTRSSLRSLVARLEGDRVHRFGRQAAQVRSSTRKQTTELASSKYGNIGAPVWSPDGKWIAYSKPDYVRTSDVYLIPSAGGEERKVTFDSFNDVEPAVHRRRPQAVFRPD